MEMEIGCAIYSSPVGDLAVLADDKEISSIHYIEEGELLPREESPLAALGAHQLGEYFAGERKEFDLPLKWSLVEGMTQGVLSACAAIPAGETRSYGEVAGLAGYPRAARAAGTILRQNPWTIVVPCHRVIHADGSLGAYHGQKDDRKATLLNIDRS